MIAEVVIDRRIDLVLDYVVPDFLSGKLQIGHRVRVPLGKRHCQGYVTALKDYSNCEQELKPITALCDEEPLLAPQLVELARWVAEYYIAPLVTVIFCMIPPSIRRSTAPERSLLHVRAVEGWKEDQQKITPAQKRLLDLLNSVDCISLSVLQKEYRISKAVVTSLHRRGAVVLVPKKVESTIAKPEFVPSLPHQLNSEQSTALQNIVEALYEERRSPRPILLHGVTGSGKTEIYLQAIEHCLKLERSALVLVPEISLTPQTIERFCARFEQYGEKVAVLHSHLSDAERAQQWLRIRRGQVRIVVGTRSAVFSPLRKLGLIIVDEEHDSSYKQAEVPRYHARDVAVMRARLEKAVVVLGSATPSLESYYNAQCGRYTRVQLSNRVDGRQLPSIRLVDMRREQSRHRPAILSRLLVEAIEKRLTRKEQTILFLNRRGYSPAVCCLSCGQVVMCQNCSVTMVYHRQRERMLCHLCGHQDDLPTKCPECGSSQLLFGGFGTERAEHVLKAFFPKAVIRRADSDSLRGRDAHAKLFQEFRRGEIDILIGTQMIAKGLDFPNVTLVGVLHADTALNLPDFRASERVFQLLTQVAGRAGRGDVPGEVILQTYLPHHTAIQAARHYDWQTFYTAECEFRKGLGYPPYRRCTLITVRAKQESLAAERASALRESLCAVLPDSVEVGLPVPAPVAKLSGQFRQHIFLKYARGFNVQRYLRPVVMNFLRHRDATLQCDVDPLFLL